MKFLETHFDEYISSSTNKNLHPKLDAVFNQFPKNLSSLSNFIFYGPAGVGKYTQVLKLLSRHSPSELVYEKKTCVTFNKNLYFLKISDIHYEVDMSLLGCNSKLLWHDIFLHIVDIISAKKERIGVIVCKCFNQIHSELLDNFYSYMQTDYSLGIKLRFIIISSSISFIPENIVNCCKIISIPRPSDTNYKKCFKQYNKSIMASNNISNIKILTINANQLMTPHKIVCNCIIDNMTNYENISYYKFRDLLYDVFIYDINVGDSIWYILSILVQRDLLKRDKLSAILKKTYEFFKYYNNNYRPIYHLENYLLTVIKIMNDL
jgi:hypothetical protein